jgi:hypothetical protein
MTRGRAALVSFAIHALAVLALGACGDSRPGEAKAPPASPAAPQPPAAPAAAEAQAAPSLPAQTVAVSEQVNAAAKIAPATTSACSFTQLAAFEGRMVKWEGECAEGRARGSGVLRAYPTPGSREGGVLIFFGMLDHGDPKLGVIETNDGYVAGEFAAGRPLPSEDRNVLIRAFDQAAQAAKLVSQRFEAKGNKDSAAFYAKKAQRLLQQMD